MHDITYSGLHGWSSSLFEKFGYMILASCNGDHNSTKCYIKNIESLHEYVLEKLEQLYKMNQKEHSILLDDKIHDMKILRDNIDKLHRTAIMVFIKKNTESKVKMMNKDKKIINKNKKMSNKKMSDKKMSNKKM